MKTLKIGLCFLIILLFSACSKGEFRNIISFTDSYNNLSDYNLKLDDFIVQGNEYTAFFENCVLLHLKEDENNKINICRVVAEKSSLSDNQTKNIFIKTVRNTILAYCDFTSEEAEKIIESFNFNDDEMFIKTGELTTHKDNFYFIYYANEITCEMRIINTYIKDIDPTEKPVSKPYFGEDFIEKSN